MDKIQLQKCHVTQMTERSVKGVWLVKNEAGKVLAELPKELDEKQVMACIHFARKFELTAFNFGIQFGKTQNGNGIELVPDERKRLLRIIDELTKSNHVLADQFDKISINGNLN